MKKLMLIFSTLSILMGCTKELKPKSDISIEREFSASFLEETKTSLEPSGKVNWSKGDVVSYYSASDGAVSTTSVPEDSHSFSFTAKVGVDDSFIVAAYGGTISAPQDKGMTLSGVAEQEQSGKFEDAHVSVCKRYFDNGNVLSFKNITSLIKFTLTRTDVSYITFTAGKGEKIHGDGKVYFSFSGEDITAAFGEKEGGSDIRVNTNGAGTFYMSTLPKTIEGFTVKYFDNAGKAIGMTTSAKTLTIAKGNSIVNLGVLDSKIEDIPPIDLSANGTANCYIASELGCPYKFKANVKGNSIESVGAIKKAKVLWESFGTDVTPIVGDVVATVVLDGEYIRFSAIQNGNAVIAAVDADGATLWSWHIWVCKDFDPKASAQVYKNNAGTMMDRNLGATSATPGDVHALGLLYQWGRKDPFLSGQSISSSATAASTLSWPSSVKSNLTNGNIAYAIAHPTTFITNNSSNYDWYYTGSSSTDNTRWQTSDKTKGIYDPCPVGYRVPDGGTNTTTQPYAVWSKAFGSSSYYGSGPWDGTNNGMNFGSGNGRSSGMQLGSATTIWYPAAGCRDSADGSLSISAVSFYGLHGLYWSCTPHGNLACLLNFYGIGFVIPSNTYYRAIGQSVRCLSESK